MNPTESLAQDILDAGNEHFQIASHPGRVLFWTTDSSGGCAVVSANWSERTGQALEEARGNGWLNVVLQEDRAHVADAVRRAVAAHHGLYLHYRIARPDGSIFRVLHDAAVRSLPSGKFNGLVGTLTDETDMKVGENAIEHTSREIYEFLDSANLCAFAMDLHGRVVFANPLLAVQCGKTPGELVGQDWIANFVAREDRPRLTRMLDDSMPMSDLPHEVEYQIDVPAGRRLFRWHLTLLRDCSARPLSITMIGSDITQWRRMGEHLRLTAQMFESSKEAMVITDRHNNIISVNPAFTRLTGYSREEALGNNPRILRSGRHDQTFYQGMWKALLEEGHWRGDIWDRRKDGTFYPKFLAITAMRDAHGEISHFSAIFYDVSERKKLEEKLETLAHFDALTGLPNRMLLQDRLEQAIATAERHNQKFALLFIDLDGFKPINDVYGHAFGDEVLRMVAQRLGEVIRSMDTAARLGGDEFVVVLTDVRDSDNAKRVAEKILAAVSRPYELAGESATLSASIGISIYPNDEIIAQELLRTADEAMYSAKREGKQRVTLYAGVR